MFVMFMTQITVIEWSDPYFEFSTRTMNLSDYDNPITLAHGDKDSVSMDLLDKFKKLTEPFSQFVEAETNLTADILAAGDASIADYRSRYIIAGDFEKVYSGLKAKT